MNVLLPARRDKINQRQVPSVQFSSSLRFSSAKPTSAGPEIRVSASADCFITRTPPVGCELLIYIYRGETVSVHMATRQKVVKLSELERNFRTEG